MFELIGAFAVAYGIYLFLSADSYNFEVTINGKKIIHMQKK